jgi:ATP-dependent helicase HrpB
MLPIHEVLEPLKTALADEGTAVLAAPPGAGKTTVVPLSLLGQPWLGAQRILVLEPRRLAARAAASRMADTLGEPVGQTVGYRTRMQSQVSEATRIEVITEGIFTRLILDDPGLDGVGAVLFDEFHERSLDADLGLALARESQAILREDLRLLVMSATLDVERIRTLLGGAPVIQSQGRAFPVETRYLERNAAEALEKAMARSIRHALTTDHGSVLAFLPGQAEIHRLQRELEQGPLPPSVDVLPLYGSMDKGEQDRVLSPSLGARRKVVLATSIAETSLTIDGIRIVIDSGLSRVPRFDVASGLTRLATVRVSRSSAEQRRGRAGRVEPGVCYRLWHEAETRGLVPHQPAEILQADLTGLVLDLARWGRRSVEGLALLDPPPVGAMAEARRVLLEVQALGSDGTLTEHGMRLSRMPLTPRLAHMLIRAAEGGQARHAALIAALLSEPGLGGNSSALDERLQGLLRDSFPRARDARRLAERWARMASEAAGVERQMSDVDMTTGLLLALAFPERVGRAQGKGGEFRLSSGRGAYLPATDPLASEPWLAVAELGGGDSRDRIRLAAPVSPQELIHLTQNRETVRQYPGRRPELIRMRCIGEIVLDEMSLGVPDKQTLRTLLKAQADAAGPSGVRWGPRSSALRARLAFVSGLEAGWPDVSDQGLWGERETWFWPLLDKVDRLEAVTDADLEQALTALVPWDRHRRLNELAPRELETALSKFAIDYAAEGGPRVDIRVQELFGQPTHPTVGHDTPLTLALLSPARRPIQITKDLPGFWAGSWADVRAEMRGRYPKHPWPVDPAGAAPTNRTKKQS